MRFTAGDRVQITAGPFEGRDAVVVTVEAHDGDSGILVEVEAEVFQRLVRLSLTPEDLQALPL